MTPSASRIDVRTIPPQQRHAQIFGAFDALAGGEALELVNDHDPRPLYYQFNAQVPGQFAWDYLESGPQLWRVAITRTQAGPGAEGGSCCGGGCGG